MDGPALVNRVISGVNCKLENRGVPELWLKFPPPAVFAGMAGAESLLEYMVEGVLKLRGRPPWFRFLDDDASRVGGGVCI